MTVVRDRIQGWKWGAGIARQEAKWSWGKGSNFIGVWKGVAALAKTYRHDL